MTVLRLQNDHHRFEILSLGASLHSFSVRQPDGSWRNVVLTRPDPDIADSSYFGATIGRLANRVDAARVTIAGVDYQLVANEGRNQLHGGPAGFAEAEWAVLSASDTEAVLQLVSPDGDQGYPGTLTTTARFALVEGGAEVTYTATTDAPTVVSLSIHPYFILGDATIADHTVTVRASSYTPTRDDLIPTGEVRSVAGTGFDLRAGRLLGEVIAACQAEGLTRKGAIDQNFVIDGEGLREHVRLTGPSGLTVVVRSDAPAVQLYSGDHLGRTGLAIEPQNCPDAPNHAGFGSVELLPGDTYRATVQWLVG